MEAAGPAFYKASQNAKANKAMYGRLFSSTPGDLDSRPGFQASQVLSKTCTWTESLYDMYAKEGRAMVEEYVNKNSENGIVYIEYDYLQLGFDEDWFINMCRVVNNKPVKIKREILLHRISGSQLSPFTPEQLMELESLPCNIIEEIFILPLFKLDIYERLDREKCYFIGVDMSSGYGEDNTAVVVLDPYSEKVVASFQSAFIGVPDVIKFLRLLVSKYIPRALLCIERNHQGESVISFLRKTNVAHNLYYNSSKELELDLDVTLDNKGLLKREAERRRMFGVWTGPQSRKRMMTLLDRYMVESMATFRSKMVVNDIKKLIKKNGKVEAQSGFHDDAIMATLIALYVLNYGDNLMRFGFYKGEFLDNGEKRQRTKEEEYQEYTELIDQDDSLRDLFGNNIATNTVNDYMTNLIKQNMQLKRRSLDEVDEYRTDSGIVKITEFNHEIDDFESTQETNTDHMDDDFFDFLNG